MDQWIKGDVVCRVSCSGAKSGSRLFAEFESGPQKCFWAVLWIRNDFNRIRILLFKPGQLNKRKILRVHNGTTETLFMHFFKICNERRMGPFSRKIYKNYTDFLVKKARSGSGSGTNIPEPYLISPKVPDPQRCRSPVRGSRALRPHSASADPPGIPRWPPCYHRAGIKLIWLQLHSYHRAGIKLL